MSRRQTYIYGIVVAVAVFFVGWSTGMGGSFLPNLIFSILVGGFAVIAVTVAMKFRNSTRDK